MITDYIIDVLMASTEMVLMMAPYLLLGFLIAGLMHGFMPRSFSERHLHPRTMGSVVKASLFGVPLPLCSCGVVPTAMSMRREGASKGATIAFLIATPQTGVDSIAATYSVLGLPMAIVRPITAFVTALFGGFVANRFDNDDCPASEAGSCSDGCCGDGCCDDELLSGSLAKRLALSMRYAFYNMLQDMGKWLFIGIVIAAVISISLPGDTFTRLSAYPIANMLLVLVLSVPMYLCATGSIPIALALMLKGLSPGAALVLLMAGPATNAASILMIYKVMGRTATAIYLAAIVVGSMAFGLAVDYLLPAGWFDVSNCGKAICSQCASVGWIEGACGVALLLAYGIGRGYRKCLERMKSQKQLQDMTVFKIEGMMCSHCQANVERTIKQIDGVDSVEVILGDSIARVSGTAPAEAIIAAVEAAGYKCRVADN
ncbi:MAG: SO_0444 family Cu/Zn efflux transporter [Muribaculaceae bacterium]